MTFAQLVQSMHLQGQQTSHELYDWIVELMKECDKAWSATAEARLRCDDLTASYEQGKAHALSAVLGDREALQNLGIL